ncbi:phosphotransferase family protein [Humibacillus xanthopallidus]|uniref:phosphotransferase family protein n=1 Tax=Humibacillus xanthopallidus TaxID=412689 RepID=UPI0011521EB3|nr:phosphotransferase [Humibacillus xanthopallidus]
MSAARGAQSLPSLVERIVAEHLPGVPVRLALVSLSRDPNPKTVLLALPVPGEAPALAVKVGFTDTARHAVRAEARALLDLEQLDPDRLGATVPQCMQLREEPGLTALVTTAAAGRPMATDYHLWGHTSRCRSVERDFAAAGSWLTGLARIRGDSSPVTAPVGQQLVQRWPDDEVAAKACAACADVEDRLSGLGHRSDGVTHGDFWAGNLLRDPQLVSGVVDWERAHFGADPLWDRVRFALAYTLYLDRHTPRGRAVRGHGGLRAGRPGEPVRYLLRSSGWYAACVADFVAGGLPPRGRTAWREAVLVGLAQIAAESDEPAFARLHVELLAELAP